VTTADDVSSATLTGLADIAIESLAPSDPNPTPGEQITLSALVANESAVDAGAFDVTLQSGDPHFPQIPPVLIGTQHITSLAAGQVTLLQFPLTVPSAAGNYVFT